jgi:transposase InsO family protein
MTNMLREFINEFVIVYFDDIVVYSKTIDEHREHVKKILQRMRKHKIHLKAKKCEFEVTKTKYLGYMMSGETAEMLEEKVKEILDWPELTDLKSIERFRGLAGYYRRFVEKFSDKMRPLNECLQKKEFKWNESQQESFKIIKEAIAKRIKLRIFDYEKPITVYTDASDYGIGGEIRQPTDEKNKNWEPVLFYSRKLTSAEMNYTTADKEMLAIVQMMKKYQHYLRDTKYPVVVKTDHRNLRTFMTKKDLNARQARWAEELTKYDFVIEYVKGSENKIADALSRKNDEDTGVVRNRAILEETNEGLRINRQAELKVAITRDKEDLIELIRKNPDQERVRGLKPDEKGLFTMRGLIIVPRKLEENVIERHHNNQLDGHWGEARTIEKIQRMFYFPGMLRKVKRYIRRCEECQKNKEDKHKPYGKMQQWQYQLKQPWRHIAMDFMTNIPRITERSTGRVKSQILVIVDKFTKQTILIPVSNNETTESVIRILWERIFTIFGIPLTITTDRDKLFTSNEWQKEMKELKIEHVASTAEHQQTNGQSERKIQEVTQYLRNYLNYEQKNWIELLPKAQFAINDAYNETIGMTPYQAMFGRHGRWDSEESIEANQMKPIHKSIENEIEWKMRKIQERYNKRRTDAPSLKEGEKVYLKRRNFHQKKFHVKTKRSSTKLDNLKLGPFLIDKELGHDNYQLRLPKTMKIHPVFHISRLEKTDNPETKDSVEAIEEEYDVEKILDMRKNRKGEKEYLIKWLDYSDQENTWEPRKNLNCDDKIQEFEQKRIKHSL